ncbi:hypothetical protein [Nonomuraea sediminis]|uniref:hypothetical protein n=1 Tax=Nonomuraea sediminis TaxID=2835864 RepID=UPI001BDDACE2|nr:hypothetical protein [Nonomuraea sediminis]
MSKLRTALATGILTVAMAAGGLAMTEAVNTTSASADAAKPHPPRWPHWPKAHPGKIWPHFPAFKHCRARVRVNFFKAKKKAKTSTTKTTTSMGTKK